MQITIPQDIQPQLQRRGTSPEVAAVAVLRESLTENGGNGQSNLAEEAMNEDEYPTVADHLVDYIGAIDTSEVIPGGAQLSTNSSEKFKQILLDKHRRKSQ
jgi:hypothetical protein